MKVKLPQGTRAEKVEFARNLRRQDELERPHIKMTRTKRRVVVAALLSFVIAELAWLAALVANLAGGNKATAILYFLAGAQALCFVVLTYSVGDLTQKPDLDERERAQRDHATASAYKILGLVVAFGFLGAIIANGVFQWAPAFRPDLPLSAYLLPFAWLVASLPMAVIAWTLPDPVPDTKDDHI